MPEIEDEDDVEDDDDDLIIFPLTDVNNDSGNSSDTERYTSVFIDFFTLFSKRNVNNMIVNSFFYSHHVLSKYYVTWIHISCRA